MPFVSLFVENEEIRLNSEGIWLSNGSEITHPGTLRMFAQNLKRDDQGYFIAVAHETKRVVVEDTPYFVTAIRGDRNSGYEIILNDETREPLDPRTLKFSPTRLTCELARKEKAKFQRGPYNEILRELHEDQKFYYLLIQGNRFDLLSK